MTKKETTYLDHLATVFCMDFDKLIEAHKSYGDSCLKRGGVGLFMMFARKWDRLENQVKKHNYDIFAAFEADQREEGILDDIRDLRRYLGICEAEILRRYPNRFPSLTAGVDVSKDRIANRSMQGHMEYKASDDPGSEAGPGYVNQDRGGVNG